MNIFDAFTLNSSWVIKVIPRTARALLAVKNLHLPVGHLHCSNVVELAVAVVGLEAAKAPDLDGKERSGDDWWRLRSWEADWHVWRPTRSSCSTWCHPLAFDSRQDPTARPTHCWGWPEGSWPPRWWWDCIRSWRRDIVDPLGLMDQPQEAREALKKERK